MAIPEIHPETEFERDMLIFLDNKELLFYSALKAIRSDISELRRDLQVPKGNSPERPFDRAADSLE